MVSLNYTFGLGPLKLLNKGSRLRPCRVKWEDNNHITDNNQTGRQQGGDAHLEAHTVEDRKEIRKWTPTEDVVLISAWLNTSKDPVVGNEQKAIAFWKRIASYVAASPKLAGLQKREASHCKQRWGKINEGISKFVGCYDAATKEKSSGQNETDVMKMAHEIFFNDYKVKFTLEHAWLELHHDQKWCGASTTKDKVQSRRRKLDDQSAQSSTYVPGEEDQSAKPVGVKATKAEAKSSVSKPILEEERREFQSMWEIRQKDFPLKEKLNKQKLLDSLIAKTEPLSELELALKNKLISVLVYGCLMLMLCVSLNAFGQCLMFNAYALCFSSL
ncbi:PREDICTED: glutathione S-transferase T3-like [Brassica oleracea var. oleracea]|uniref:glutathione S-transferase T3-like n=1 Tax=Brassica oleracea var. oleracea TaxID=109376 RepID=UPI0006A71E94|nr:PREDICTED: glutathione S-transferase T3-like [Brassica oleracea var. oleracea]